MPAPFPYEFVSGRRNIDSQAAQIFGHYGWMARWSDEIVADADLDLKKLFQLREHCRMYREALAPFLPLEKLDAPIAVALLDYFSSKGVKFADEAAMATILTERHDAAGVLQGVIDVTFPAPRAFSQRAFDANGAEIEIVTKADKAQAQAAVDAVLAFHAGYEAKPEGVAALTR